MHGFRVARIIPTEFFAEGDSDLQIVGNSELLAQVVTNLLTNAAKYSKEARQVLLHVGCVGNFAKISVTDIGIGISKTITSRSLTGFIVYQQMIIITISILYSRLYVELSH